MKKLLLSALFTASFLTASAQYTDGVYVLNEGGIGSENASISFLKGEVVQNNLYAAANNDEALGDTGQSISFKDGKAYIVLNYSNKLVIANASTLVKEAAITEGLENPRYTAFYGNYAYVTCWGDAGDAEDDYIAVINLADNTITTTIPVVEGPERIITSGDKIYVAQQGGYGVNDKVSVIDAVTNTLSSTITVGEVPNSIFEKDGYLYVLCGGNPGWAEDAVETPGKFFKINLADNTVAQEITFPDATHPSNLETYGDFFYYTIDENVFRKDLETTTLPAAALISLAPQGVYGIYGFDIIDDKLYLADAGDYSTPGTAYVYTVEGVLVDDFEVGVIPNSFYKSPAAVAGTGDFNALTVAVYPNPASEVLYINTDKAASVKLYDLSGRVVAEQAYTVSGINVSALPSGSYFAEITIDNAKTVKQIIVQ